MRLVLEVAAGCTTAIVGLGAVQVAERGRCCVAAAAAPPPGWCIAKGAAIDVCQRGLEHGETAAMPDAAVQADRAQPHALSGASCRLIDVKPRARAELEVSAFGRHLVLQHSERARCGR